MARPIPHATEEASFVSLDEKVLILNFCHVLIRSIDPQQCPL